MADDWTIDDPVPADEVAESVSYDRASFKELAEAVSTRPDGSKQVGTVAAFVGNREPEKEPGSYKGGKPVESGSGDLQDTVKLDFLVTFGRNKAGEVEHQVYEGQWVMTKTLVDYLRGRGPIVAGRIVGKRGSKGYDIEPLPAKAKDRILGTLVENGWLPQEGQQGHTGAPSGAVDDDDGF